MKKQILNIGKALSRAEQKVVFGGAMQYQGACKDSGDACAVRGSTKHTSCCEGTCDSDGGILGICS
jgi:uncharacterized protein (DUF169 family)